MTLVEPQYLDEIFGSLRMAGEEIRHFFLSLEEALLRTRIENQIMTPDDLERDAGVRQWRLDQVERCLAAKGEMPPDTVRVDGPAANQASMSCWETVSRSRPRSANQTRNWMVGLLGVEEVEECARGHRPGPRVAPEVRLAPI